MIVTAWNNGAHNRNGSGYGFKVKNADRDEFFQKEWEEIYLEIEGEPELIKADVHQDRFWSDAGKEITATAIGKWLRKNGMAPWHQGNPVTFELQPVENNRFKVLKTHKTTRQS